MIKLYDEAGEILNAFIKMHEQEEIPDNVWDLCMRLYNIVIDHTKSVTHKTYKHNHKDISGLCCSYSVIDIAVALDIDVDAEGCRKG